MKLIEAKETADIHSSSNDGRNSVIIKRVAGMKIFAGFKPIFRRQSKHHRVVVLAYGGVVLGDLATPLEIFGRVRDAEGQACYDVRVCGSAQDVQSEHLNLKVPLGLSFVARADTVIVPGIDDLERPIPPAILRALRRGSKIGTRIASICTGLSCWHAPACWTVCAQLHTGGPPKSWRDVTRKPK
jgi:putative intracellular protease/amidase